MGNYQSWRHHREVDLSLRAQLAQLEQELAQLEEQISGLSNTSVSADNTIISALITHIHTDEQHYPAQEEQEQTLPSSSSAPPPAQERVNASSSHPSLFSPPSQTVSPALQAWGHLPNFDTQAAETPAHPYTEEHASTAATASTGSTDQHEHLLPTDINAFIDANHDNSDDRDNHDNREAAPQAELPWWLRDGIYPSRLEQGDGQPPFGQNQDTDQSVERWFIRRQQLGTHSDEIQKE